MGKIDGGGREEENERQMGAEKLCERQRAQKVQYKKVKGKAGKKNEPQTTENRREKIQRRGNTTYFTRYSSSREQQV